MDGERKLARKKIAPRIASGLQKTESEIVFADRELTANISALWATRCQQISTREVPNRAAAIDLAQTELSDAKQ
jgi:hypothetical protein